MNQQTNRVYKCRLCLTETTTKIDIFREDFPKMIEILTSIKVNRDDDLPKVSCKKCAQDVKNALLTRRRIIKSYKSLVNELNTEKNEIIEKIKSESQNDFVVEECIVKEENAVSYDIPDISVIKTEHETNFSTSVETLAHNLNPIEIKKEPNTSLRREIRDRQVTLTCAECRIKFGNKLAYSAHMAKHKKSKCTICGKSIRTDNFKKHVAMHSCLPVECEMCGAKCKNTDSLRGHIFYYHKCTADQYVCEECGRTFRARYKLVMHKKKEHDNERNFKCETCGKTFYTNVNLKAHVNMTHKKLRNHVCEYCGKAFSGKYALKTHVRQHTNETPYACEFCNEGFRQKISLRAHLKSKHGVKEESKFFCQDCAKGFATDYALKIHLRLHMMKKCQYCSESFADCEYLENHIKDVHSSSIIS